VGRPWVAGEPLEGSRAAPWAEASAVAEVPDPAEASAAGERQEAAEASAAGAPPAGEVAAGVAEHTMTDREANRGSEDALVRLFLFHLPSIAKEKPPGYTLPTPAAPDKNAARHDSSPPAGETARLGP
jgi:hypothetical protein